MPIVVLLFVATQFIMKKLGVSKEIVAATSYLIRPVVVILTFIFFFAGAIKKILNDNRMI